MRKHTLALFGATSLLIATPVLAEDKPELGLSGSGQAGYSNTTGDTSTQAIYGSLGLEYTQKMYKIKAKFDATNKEEDGNRTDERYVGDLQGNLYFSDYQKAYGFGQFKAVNDRFSDIELSTYTIAGLGYNFIKRKDMILTGEAGAGYQSENYYKDSDTKDMSQAIAKLYGNFEYAFNPNVRFLQNLTVFTGEKQTNTESNTGLKVLFNSHFNMRINYQYRHNSKPAEGKKNVNTETMITLGYDF